MVLIIALDRTEAKRRIGSERGVGGGLRVHRARHTGSEVGKFCSQRSGQALGCRTPQTPSNSPQRGHAALRGCGPELLATAATVTSTEDPT
jgi:hypothetical protein